MRIAVEWLRLRLACQSMEVLARRPLLVKTGIRTNLLGAKDYEQRIDNHLLCDQIQNCIWHTRNRFRGALYDARSEIRFSRSSFS
jgi:hypothetical protein